MDLGRDLPTRPGDIIAGKYRVERVLGAGGMGVVVAVTHVELGEKRAVKFMLPSTLGDTIAVERFLREARAVAKLKSDHVARVHDVGRTEVLAPYIVMEYLEGRDLSSLLKTQGPLSIADAVQFVIQACDALAEAHATGMVHRDLKPANLFLTTGADGSPWIKVLDFGISKLNADAPSELTDTEAAIGSPYHMSPEQMRSSRKVDKRTDIWALGVILYQLVTGQLPFQGEGRFAVCFAIAQDPPIPPRELRPDLPQPLEAAILRCLEKSPEGRFPDVAALCNAIAPYCPLPETTVRLRRIARLSGAESGSALATTGTRPLVTPPSSAEEPVPASTQADATQNSWGRTPKELRARRTRLSQLALGGALVVVLGGIAVQRLVLHPSAASAPVQATALPSAPPQPPAQTAVATAHEPTAAPPLVAPAAPPPASAEPEPSAASAAKAAPRAVGAKAARPSPSAAPPPPAPTSAPVAAPPQPPAAPAATPSSASDPWGRSRKL